MSEHPDRTDAVARVLRPSTFEAEENETPGFRLLRLNALAGAKNDARTLLTTDDPAAIAALATTLWERHPDAVLTAGFNAGEIDIPKSSGFWRRNGTQWRQAWVREVTDA